jgi:hypothetical protein
MSLAEIVTRLKLFINLIDKRACGSLSYDPFQDNQEQQTALDDDIVAQIKLNLAKSLSLVVQKTREPCWIEKQVQNLRLDTPDPNNIYGVIQALKDERSISKLKQMIAYKDELYLTPYFFRHFDFECVQERDYLKWYLKFISI